MAVHEAVQRYSCAAAAPLLRRTVCSVPAKRVCEDGVQREAALEDHRDEEHQKRVEHQLHLVADKPSDCKVE